MPDPYVLDPDPATQLPAYSGQEQRLGSVTALLAAGSNPVGARGGVRPSGSGTELAVVAQATPAMTVRIRPGQAFVQGATQTAQGTYVWTLDTEVTRAVAAASPTLPRIDLVCVRIRDASVTGTARDGDVVVVTGVPASVPQAPGLPGDASYLPIAEITVPAGATAVGNGNIDNTARSHTAALGGLIVCTSATKPGLAMPGQLLYVTDTGAIEYFDPGAAQWRSVHRVPWTAYSPTWSTDSGTQPVLGNGTLAGRYRRAGNQVTVEIDFLAGVTTTFGTGTFWQFALPAPALGLNTVGNAWLLDSAPYTERTGVVLTPTPTVCRVACNVGSGLVRNNQPWTWAAGDRCRLWLQYEA